MSDVATALLNTQGCSGKLQVFEESMDVIEREGVLDEAGEDEQIAAIYTSEDEHIRTPISGNVNISHSPDSNYQIIVKTLKTDGDNDNFSDGSVLIPTKKAKLSGLVSYAIDEDDDEHTIVDTDHNTDSDHDHDHHHNNNNSNRSDNELNHINQSPITILSENQIHTISEIIINDIKTLTNHNESNEMKQSTPTLTQRLIEEIQLPSEPVGHCSMLLQERIERAVRRMRLDISYDPNRAIQDNKSFRNPSIYEKLIDFLKIDEKGTNFPTDIYDPYRWSPQSYYEELARVQNREIDRLMKLQKELKKSDTNTTTANTTTNTCPQKTLNITSSLSEKVNSTIGGSVATGYMEPKKPSKWDTGIPSANNPLHDSSTAAEAFVKQSVLPVGSLIKRN
ncbi:unnamed protein product [Heterobilharzia americana]|nr:unnamed protein product [Heterobilharzia americana]